MTRRFRVCDGVCLAGMLLVSLATAFIAAAVLAGSAARIMTSFAPP